MRFLFAVKASRFLTHMKKLKDPEEPLDRLFTRMRPLSRRLGPVLYQLPPGWKLDLGRLEHFLQVLPRRCSARGGVPRTELVRGRSLAIARAAWRLPVPARHEGVGDRHGARRPLCLRALSRRWRNLYRGSTPRTAWRDGPSG